ncbi:unnamed protein product [Lepeophtheirus salmonis]|uniref:Metalloendopeptidase n=1 Tax=Lepeophtheirus salmonis TaxID=72036 RepID=A0A7R8GZL1_LEPSM|nr:unnamed protein product [Lepeophtheirus salmonis]CAF2755106.1 unnamed protein product [Lepeophtheirus salmonis]
MSTRCRLWVLNPNIVQQSIVEPHCLEYNKGYLEGSVGAYEALEGFLKPNIADYLKGGGRSFYPAPKLKHPECRINYDKYDRQALASNRNMAQGEKWPQREVPYVIRSTFTSSETNVIKSAIAEVESKTCLKWIPRTNQINYVDINHDRAGCFAALGYNRNRGRHILNLEKFNAIDIKQTIIPPVCEFTPGKTTYDDCYSGFKTNTFGISYDYGSIMHYPLTDFSIAGEPTMDILKTVPQGVTIGNRISMTDLDAAKVKARYECHKSLEETTTRKPSVGSS